MIEKEKTKYSIFDGINLLLNKTVNVKYKYPGKRKERIEEFFSNELVEDNQKDKILLEGMEFVKKYDELFYKVAEKYNLSEIKLKQYIKNSNRNYISDGAIIYGKLSYFYETKQMDLKTLNIIINALINTNLKNNYDNKKEILMNLKLYKNCLSYIAISEKYYYIIVETFSDIEIDFAKAIVNDEELILKHNTNGNGKIMISEKKSYTSLAEINEYELIINGDIVEE